MREILFRGRDINRNWHTGLLSISQRLDGQPTKGYYISNSCGMPWAYPIDPETVGQFTGLCDKNGKKIFEGDIIKSSYDGVLKVFFNDDDMGFYPFSQPAFGGHEWANCMVGESSEYIEIIGNIYDNPELVK